LVVPDFAHAIIYVLFVWWFSTGAILYLDGLNPMTFRWTVLGATVLMAISVAVLIVTRSDLSLFGAYAAFTGSLVIWGWNEVLFLTGFVTGPNRTVCPADATGWQRFRAASLSLLHHELLILASLAGIALVTWGASNQIGLATFAVLWAMRLSTKFNIILGVPNLSEEFLPDHLVYLASFFRRRPMNLLFPVSVTAATVALVWLVCLAANPAATGFERTSLTLVATLFGLGLVEHWFLVLPIEVAGLWTWGFASRQAQEANTNIPQIQPSPRRDTSPATSPQTPVQTAVVP
jgi:putative photosynthetic complex assembly protein 2